MIKHITYDKAKSLSGRIKSPEAIYKAGEEKTTSQRKRKIMTPARRGTINRATIRKVIKEVIANRSTSNES
jgi:hypothetical protein